MAETNKQRYDRLRAAGLCIVCSKPSGGQSSCLKCRTRKNERAAAKKAKLTPEEYKTHRFHQNVANRKFRASGAYDGRCFRCCAPCETSYCPPCKEKRNVLRYKRAGHGGMRAHEKKPRYKRITLQRMQYELGKAWVDAKGWVEENWEIFDEAPDPVLYVARELLPGEEFVDESTSYR